MHKSSEKFPYTTGQLAKAISFLAKNQHLVAAMQEIDAVEAPNVNEEELLEWNRTETDR